MSYVEELDQATRERDAALQMHAGQLDRANRLERQLEEVRADLVYCRDTNVTIHEQDRRHVAKLAEIRALAASSGPLRSEWVLAIIDKADK